MAEEQVTLAHYAGTGRGYMKNVTEYWVAIGEAGLTLAEVAEEVDERAAPGFALHCTAVVYLPSCFPDGQEVIML